MSNLVSRALWASLADSSNPRNEPREPLVCSCSVRSAGSRLGSGLASAAGTVSWTEPLAYGIRCYLQGDRVGAELNGGTPASWGELLGAEKEPTRWKCCQNRLKYCWYNWHTVPSTAEWSLKRYISPLFWKKDLCYSTLAIGRQVDWVKKKNRWKIQRRKKFEEPWGKEEMTCKLKELKRPEMQRGPPSADKGPQPLMTCTKEFRRPETFCGVCTVCQIVFLSWEIVIKLLQMWSLILI